MGHRARVLIVCAALLITCFGPACAAAKPLGGMTVCLFPLVDLTPGGSLGEYVGVISDDLAVQLQQAGVVVVAAARVAQVMSAQKASPRELLSPRAAAAAARAADADIALNGFIALDKDTLKVSLRAYDARSGVLLAGLLRDLQFDISLYAFLWQAVSEMLAQAVVAPATADATPAPAAPASTDTRLTTVVFTSRQEGLEVLLANGTSLGRIEKGVLTVAAEGIDLRGPLVLEKRLDGYHSARQKASPGPVIALTPIARANDFAVEAWWTTYQPLGAGAGFRFYLLPDYLFLSPAMHISAQPAEVPGGRFTHVEPGFVVGGYLFFPPDLPFRLGVSAGIGAIFSWDQGGDVPVYFDPYVDIANLWLELNLPPVSFWLRGELEYALGGPTPNLLGQGFVLGPGSLPPISLGVLFRW